MLNFIGILDKAYEEAGNLSHGHKKFLEVGRALALKPRLIMLDEPAGGLSSEEIQDLLMIIKELRTVGITVLLVEHRMELVMELCDRISVLNFGMKIAEGTPEEIQSNEEVVKAYLG
jgi:branched-chain amino acid transport system permease protein